MARVIDNPKQLILSHAKVILYDHGYQKLSMRALSKACGIALGTIYNYYPTKGSGGGNDARLLAVLPRSGGGHPRDSG